MIPLLNPKPALEAAERAWRANLAAMRERMRFLAPSTLMGPDCAPVCAAGPAGYRPEAGVTASDT